MESTDRRVNTGVAAGSVSAFDPDIAVEGNNVYIAWVDNRSGDSFDIFLNESNNRGSAWLSAPRDIDQDSLPHESLSPKLVTPMTDMVVVGWVDYRFGFPDILTAASVDKGTTFSAPVRVDTGSGPGETGSYDIAMAADGALVGVAWADDRAGPSRHLRELLARWGAHVPAAGLPDGRLCCGLERQPAPPRLGRE